MNLAETELLLPLLLWEKILDAWEWHWKKALLHNFNMLAISELARVSHARIATQFL